MIRLPTRRFEFDFVTDRRKWNFTLVTYNDELRSPEISKTLKPWCVCMCHLLFSLLIYLNGFLLKFLIRLLLRFVGKWCDLVVIFSRSFWLDFRFKTFSFPTLFSLRLGKKKRSGGKFTASSQILRKYDNNLVDILTLFLLIQNKNSDSCWTAPLSLVAHADERVPNDVRKFNKSFFACFAFLHFPIGFLLWMKSSDK